VWRSRRPAGRGSSFVRSRAPGGILPQRRCRLRAGANDATRATLPRPTLSYVLSLVAVGLVIALVPLAYLALVGLVAWGVWLYADRAIWLLTSGWMGFLGPPSTWVR